MEGAWLLDNIINISTWQDHDDFILRGHSTGRGATVADGAYYERPVTDLV